MCYLFHPVDKNTLVLKPLHILKETNPLFIVLPQDVHSDTINITTITLYN